MTYATEDEVDWSDSSLHAASPECWEPIVDYSACFPIGIDDEEYDSLFDSDSIDERPTPECHDHCRPPYCPINGLADHK